MLPAVMDLPAQQFHINGCLDKPLPGGRAATDDKAPSASASGDISDWLSKLGLSRYIHTFVQVFRCRSYMTGRCRFINTTIS
jgi:hypothetical protein